MIVFFSGGKDSVVTLDLCCRYFKTVVPVFMYLVPGLSFNEAMIRWVKKKYGLDTILVPHFMLSEWLRYGTLRQPDFDIPIIKPVDIYNHVRSVTGIWWVAAGERISDSIVRRAMIKQSGTIDDNRGRFYPVGMWSKPDVVNYIKLNKLKVSPEAAVFEHSFRSLMPKEMYLMKKHYLDDYEKIKGWFPLIEASTKQYEYHYEH